MQIHELSRRRRTDEGVFDVVKGIGKAAGSALGAATGVTNPNAQAASAGILDPAKKLDAVRKNKDMQRVAAQLAAGWTAEATKLTKAPAAGAAPLPEAVGTYNKKTGAANLDGKTMTSLSDLPPAIQQQIQAKQQAAVPGSDATPTSAEQDAADARVAASGASPEEVAKQRAAREQTIAARTSRTAPTVKTADPSVDPRLNPTANPRLNPTANPAINPTANPAINPTANPAAATTTPTKPGAPPGFNAANVMKMPGMQPAGKKPAPASAATTPKPGAPPGFNAANVMKMPGMPGQPATPGSITPGAAGGGAGQPDAVTPPADPAEKEYWNKFLAYVNKKTAIRDASTYQMIGLDQIQKQSGYKNELEAAKAKILQAYKAGQDVTPAATEYILTAMAGAQLISSKNRAGVELEQPEVDPNDPDAAAGATGDNGAAAGGAAPGTAPGTAPTAGGRILDTAGVQGLFKLNGVDPALLPKLGTELRRASGTNAVTTTGNGTVDNMLKALGFKVT
jgi:hypothetical protein